MPRQTKAQKEQAEAQRKRTEAHNRRRELEQAEYKHPHGAAPPIEVLRRDLSPAPFTDTGEVWTSGDLKSWASKWRGGEWGGDIEVETTQAVYDYILRINNRLPGRNWGVAAILIGLTPLHETHCGRCYYPRHWLIDVWLRMRDLIRFAMCEGTPGGGKGYIARVDALLELAREDRCMTRQQAETRASQVGVAA